MLNYGRATIRNLVFVAALFVAALLLVLWPEASEAQCAMCRTAVQAGGEQAQRTMLKAMLVLLIPTVLIFCSIFAVFLRYGKRRDNDSENDSDGRR